MVMIVSEMTIVPRLSDFFFAASLSLDYFRFQTSTVPPRIDYLEFKVDFCLPHGRPGRTRRSCPFFRSCWGNVCQIRIKL